VEFLGVFREIDIMLFLNFLNDCYILVIYRVQLAF